MRRLGTALFIVTMATLILLLGSCSSAQPVSGERPALQEASAGTLLPTATTAPGRDSTAFLVGEFTMDGGTLARFNGSGSVTMVGSQGNGNEGTYAMTEYEAQEAVVSITIDGRTEEYSYALTAQDGSFSLTGPNGAVFTFTSVQY